MTEIICDRCGDDCGKQGTARLTLEYVRTSGLGRVFDLCNTCTQVFDKFILNEPAPKPKAKGK